MDDFTKTASTAVTEVRQAASDILAPKPRSPVVDFASNVSTSYSITLEGLAISATVGALFGIGTGFLEPPYARRTSIVRKALGWAAIATGIYVVLPTSARRSWAP